MTMSVPKEFSGERIIFSINDVVIIGYAYVKKNKTHLSPFIIFTSYKEINSKWIIDLSLKTKTTKLGKNRIFVTLDMAESS